MSSFDSYFKKRRDTEENYICKISSIFNIKYSTLNVIDTFVKGIDMNKNYTEDFKNDCIVSTKEDIADWKIKI